MITRECEEIIEALVHQHGYAKVKRELETLIPKAKWNDWQSICSYLDRLERRKPSARSRGKFKKRL